MTPTADQSEKKLAPGRRMDFAHNKPRPAAVTSAKAAINARYAERAQQPAPKPVTSAREAVNAASSQARQHDTKSASSLHHGQIQKNIERSQPSASALLRRARSPRPPVTEVIARDSFDPLAERQRPETTVDTPATHEIPVVRTSLKLGSSKPKAKPVVLPPNSRMARVARPVNRPQPKQPVTLMTHRSLDPQMVQPGLIKPRTKLKPLPPQRPELPTPPAQDKSSELAVQIIASAKKTALPAKASTPPAQATPMPSNSGRRMSDVRRPTRSRVAAPLWPQPVSTTPEVDSVAPASKPARFRPAPKDYTQPAPAPLPADSSYVIAAPPKLNLAHAHEQPHVSNLEDYYAPRIATEDESASKPELKKRPADNNRYALGGESPFLKEVNVEKRPLSANAKPRPAAETTADKPKSGKSRGSRKNVYAKKGRKSTTAQHDLPERPTVIIPSSRRSKVPLFVLIVVTIILGAVVGAAAYLCFFQ